MNDRQSVFIGRIPGSRGSESAPILPISSGLYKFLRPAGELDYPAAVSEVVSQDLELPDRQAASRTTPVRARSGTAAFIGGNTLSKPRLGVDWDDARNS